MKRAGELAVQFALQVYKRIVSPWLPPACRYVPTCSEYAMEAVDRCGVMRGGRMALWRLIRCHPLSKGGYDPVCTTESSTQGEPLGCARISR